MLASLWAMTCPRCATGELARRQAFGEDVWFNLTVAALPFLLVGLASIWADRTGRRGPSE